MLRRLIEDILGSITDTLFREACLEATNDIIINRVSVGAKTQLSYIVYVMVTYINIVQKIERSQRQAA